MQRKHDYSTLVPDALAIIAACTNARPSMELAVALRAVVTGTVLLPPDRAETISRIAADLMNPRWNLQAHITLKDPLVQYHARAFFRACIQAVPPTADNPKRDLVWQGRVKTALERDASLQAHAKAFLQGIKLRVTPAQAAATPSIAPKRDKAELHAKAKQFAEEFVRRQEAQKARAAEAVAANSAPAPETPAKAERIPEVATHAPVVPVLSKRRLRSFLRSTRLEDYLPSVPPFEPNHSMIAPPS
jgi:hypothetical protein